MTDVEILRKALMHFGVGNWSAMISSGCLPGKTIGQLNSQTQRLLGQQSTAEYADLHIDVLQVGADNAKRDAIRKAGIIVNMGRPLSREEIKIKIEENRSIYEVEERVWKNIQLPSRPFIPVEQALEEKRAELIRLKAEQMIIKEILISRK